MNGIELIFEQLFSSIFGSDAVGRLLFGLVGFIITLVFFAVLRPPVPVMLTSSGLLVLLVFGSMFGGIGLSPAVVFAGAFIMAVLLFFAFRRLLPNW
jgi:hypothetical protein